MPDPGDRFGDLGPGERTAAERLAELDERPAPEAPPPAPPRPSSAYSWVIGVAFLIVVVVAGTNALRNEGEALRGLAAGERLPAFAAPSATGELEGDVNLAQKASDPDALGAKPACEVRGEGIVNLCELRKRPLVLTFIFKRAADCEPQLDRVERVRAELPGVNFAGVVSGESREEVERLVRDRGWGFPVAVDRDGQLANVYRIGGCPTTTFAYRGGRVRETRIANLGEAALRAAARRLLRGPRRRAG